MRKREHHQHQQVYPPTLSPALVQENSNNKPRIDHVVNSHSRPLAEALCLPFSLLLPKRFVNGMIINIIVTRLISPLRLRPISFDWADGPIRSDR